MSPVADLTPVAKAGRVTGETYRAMVEKDPVAATTYLIGSFMRYVGTGGVYDYQRRGNQISGNLRGDFVQRRQFRSVSNFNAGLFGQQAGLTLEETLKVAHTYARFFGRVDPNAPEHLMPETEKFIKEGYIVGQSGAFAQTTQP